MAGAMAQCGGLGRHVKDPRFNPWYYQKIGVWWRERDRQQSTSQQINRKSNKFIDQCQNWQVIFYQNHTEKKSIVFANNKTQKSLRNNIQLHKLKIIHVIVFPWLETVFSIAFDLSLSTGSRLGKVCPSLELGRGPVLRSVVGQTTLCCQPFL